MTGGNTEELNVALSGRYRIDRQLGAGGMATVYLAHDIKHDRKVALKVLRPELAAVVGAERFLTEIKTTANLQHPHVLALFDSGQVGGTVFYVMPFVDGESLRDRIEREKQLPIDDALRIAREVGDALHYAHGLGVIHRDVKPENILLQGGHAQVADFGIALAASKTGGTRMTETGMSLGTPKYMSPEQAMGERTIDARTDVYALGCVLYEMLTGDAPFTGSTAQGIMAKVLTEKPAPILPRRDRVPAYVEDAVLTALEKLPADRFATAAEFVVAISGASGATSASTRARTGARAATTTSRRQLIVVAATVAAFAVAGGWLIGSAGANAEAPASYLALVEPGQGPAFSGVARSVDISADGRTIAYSARHPLGTRLLVRKLDASAPVAIPATANAFHVRLSPDGQALYAGQGAAMHRIQMGGTTWTPLNLEATSFLHYAEDGVLWWSGMLSTGSFRRGLDGHDSLVFPRSTVTQVIQGGRYGLGTENTTGTNSGLATWLDLRTGATRRIFEAPVVELRYTMGYLLYVRPDGVMLAAPFDARSGTITGAHVEIARDVSVSGAGFAQFGVSDNGTVVFVPGFNNDLVRVSRSGETRVLLSDLRRYHSPRISPEGQRVAYDDVTADGRDVWIVNMATRDVSRATFQRDGHDVVWAADGRAIHYLAGRGGKLDIYRTQLGSSATPTAFQARAELSYTGTPLADRSIITMVPGRAGRGTDIVRLRPDSAATDTLLATTADESYVVPSPNGRWFAYTSDHSGRPELYVRAMSGSDVQLQVSVDGASEPMWARDGRELFYRRPTSNGAELTSATLDLGSEPRVTSRKSLFDVSNFDAAGPHANYDVSPDGSWFVFARRAGADHIVVLQNVPELARRIARTGATP